MQADYIWHLWPARHWPALPEEEVDFVDTLTQYAAGSCERPERLRPGLRADVTALINALRTGLSVEALLTFLPGSSPAELLAAYEHLEHRRALSAQAWGAIVADPTPATLRTHSTRAGQLMPTAIRRLHLRIGPSRGPGLHTSVEEIVAQTNELRAIGLELEGQLRQRSGRAAVTLGTQLHNPHNPALWGADFFLPERVGTLSPIRIADLLGGPE